MCLAHLDCISCFLPGSLRKAFWFVGPWHPRPSDFLLLKTTAAFHSLSKLSLKGLDLDTQREGLGQTWATCLILGWGMAVAILTQVWKCLAGAWVGWAIFCTPDPGMDYMSQCGSWNHLVVTLWYKLERQWQALGRGDGPSPQHTRPAAVRRADPASSPMYHRITGLGQAPRNLRGAMLTPSASPF